MTRILSTFILALLGLTTACPALAYMKVDGGMFTFFSAEAIAVNDTTGYLLEGAGGINIVDLSDPDNPTSKFFVDSPGNTSVAISGGKLYVGHKYGFAIYTIKPDGSVDEVPDKDDDGYTWVEGLRYQDGRIRYTGADGYTEINPTEPMAPDWFTTTRSHASPSIGVDYAGWSTMVILASANIGDDPENYPDGTVGAVQGFDPTSGDTPEWTLSFTTVKAVEVVDDFLFIVGTNALTPAGQTTLFCYQLGGGAPTFMERVEIAHSTYGKPSVLRLLRDDILIIGTSKGLIAYDTLAPGKGVLDYVALPQSEAMFGVVRDIAFDAAKETAYVAFDWEGLVVVDLSTMGEEDPIDPDDPDDPTDPDDPDGDWGSGVDGGGSSGGCTMNPNSKLGIEWLLLGAFLLPRAARSIRRLR